eukprot:1152438-Pelagomonas_calceolata.AAC.1
MFLTELLFPVLLHSAGLAVAHRECQGPDLLAPGLRNMDKHRVHLQYHAQGSNEAQCSANNGMG